MFFAFDLVWLDGVDLRQTPLVERKKKLKRLIERSDCTEILYAQHIERNGKLLFEECLSRNLEGVVAKRRMGIYAEHGWLKIKNSRYTQAVGRQDMFTAFRERHHTPGKTALNCIGPSGVCIGAKEQHRPLVCISKCETSGDLSTLNRYSI